MMLISDLMFRDFSNCWATTVPMSTYSTARGQNTTTWAEIQDLFAEQSRENDVERRLALLRQVGDLWLDDAPLADIYWSTSTFNIHKKIQNWNPHPSIYASSMMHEHIWCDPAC